MARGCRGAIAGLAALVLVAAPRLLRHDADDVRVEAIGRSTTTSPVSGAAPAQSRVESGATPAAPLSSVASTVAASPPTPASAASSGVAVAPARLVESEELGPSSGLVPDDTATGGAFFQAPSAEITSGLPRGHYLLTARVRAGPARRIELTTDSERVAAVGVSGAWSEISSTVFVAGPGQRVGVRSSDSVDAPLDVDWFRLSEVPAGFTTRGTAIIGPDGNPLPIRGVNRSGYEWWPQGGRDFNRPRHESAFMREWGFNMVRLPLSQEYWLTNCPVAGSTVHEDGAAGAPHGYREVIAEEVRRFTGAGLLTVLDLHVSPGGVQTGCERVRPAEMPDRGAVEFWRSAAEAFKDQPLVAFDLYNEPHLEERSHTPRDPDQVWREGGTISRIGLPVSISYDAVGMQTLYDTVRVTGARNLVFVSGLRYALDVGVHVRRPLDGYGIVAAPHTYCNGCSPPGPGEGHEEALFGGTGVPGVASQLPVVVTEFGTDDASDAETNSRFLQWMGERGLGWAVYVWAPGGTASDEDRFGILDPDVRDRRVPNPAGQPVLRILGVVD